MRLGLLPETRGSVTAGALWRFRPPEGGCAPSVLAPGFMRRYNVWCTMDRTPNKAARMILKGDEVRALAAMAGVAAYVSHARRDQWRWSRPIVRAREKLTRSQIALLASAKGSAEHTGSLYYFENGWSGRTADDHASDFDVSRRSYFQALKLRRSERDDLLWEVAKGNMSLKRAVSLLD